MYDIRLSVFNKRQPIILIALRRAHVPLSLIMADVLVVGGLWESLMKAGIDDM